MLPGEIQQPHALRAWQRLLHRNPVGFPKAALSTRTWILLRPGSALIILFLGTISCSWITDKVGSERVCTKDVCENFHRPSFHFSGDSREDKKIPRKPRRTLETRDWAAMAWIPVLLIFLSLWSGRDKLRFLGSFPSILDFEMQKLWLKFRITCEFLCLQFPLSQTVLMQLTCFSASWEKSQIHLHPEQCLQCRYIQDVFTPAEARRPSQYLMRFCSDSDKH